MRLKGSAGPVRIPRAGRTGRRRCRTPIDAKEEGVWAFVIAGTKIQRMVVYHEKPKAGVWSSEVFFR